MPRPTFRSHTGSHSGCLLLAGTCLVTCLLLIVNAVVVGSTLGMVMSVFPDWLRRPKFEQGLMFVLPVVFTAIQWWIADWIVFRTLDRHDKTDRRSPPDSIPSASSK